MSPAVFFDRDGTLMEDVGYCRRPEDVRVYPGVPDALRRLKQAGFVLIIVTNQSGISRGLLTEEQFKAAQAEFDRQTGHIVDAVYYCPDAPGVLSERRKPAPGMVLEAAEVYRIDLARSYMVGDKASDIECGRRAGLRTIRVRTGHGVDEPEVSSDDCATDVVEAAVTILDAIKWGRCSHTDPSPNEIR